MTTSGTYTFNETRNQIIEGAYRKLRLIAENQLPLASQYQHAGDALNAMVKAWRTDNTFVWNQSWITVPLHASNIVTGSDGLYYECIRNHVATALNKPITGGEWMSYWKLVSTTPTDTWTLSTAYVSICHYYLDTNIIGIDRGFVREQTQDTYLSMISKENYFGQGAKMSAGKPTQYYFRRQPTPELFVYPYPDSITKYVLNLDVYRTPQDITLGTQTTDFVQEWIEALIYNLAVRLHLEVGILDPGEVVSLKQEAQMAYLMAKAGDGEKGDVRFQVDFRF